MAKTLTDLSQLTKAILRESPPPSPVKAPAPESAQSREDADAAAAPQPKKKAVFQLKPAKDDFLAKLRLHRKRYGW